ncbi:MAG: hypothetical protein ACRDRR_18270 [Pseudonocardiaceae bacterium]
MPDNDPDVATHYRRTRDSITAKLATLPKADSQGRFEVDENATRHPVGVVEPVEPKPVAGKGDRR